MPPFLVDTKKQSFLQADFCAPSPEERKVELCVNRISHWITRTLNYGPCGINCHYLAYCINGSGEIRIGRKRYPVQPGDIAIVPAHTASAMADDPQTGWEIYWIHFSGNYAEHLMSWNGFSLINPVRHIGMQDSAIQKFEIMLHELTNKKPYYVYRATQALLGLFIDLKQSTATSNDHISDWMANMSWRTSGIDELVKMANCSKPHFIRKFKKISGISPWKYVLNLKVDKAKSMLLDQSVSVKSISTLLGFSHASYFSRLFKHITGVSPELFRAQHRSVSSDVVKH
jgi:AraC family transcriptional regulator of arabinose operon